MVCLVLMVTPADPDHVERMVPKWVVGGVGTETRATLVYPVSRETRDWTEDLAAGGCLDWMGYLDERCVIMTINMIINPKYSSYYTNNISQVLSQSFILRKFGVNCGRMCICILIPEDVYAQ